MATDKIVGEAKVKSIKEYKNRINVLSTELSVNLPLYKESKKGLSDDNRKIMVFNLNASSPGSRIVNNIFGPFRRSGVLIKSPNSIVANNIFIMVDVNAIRIKTEMSHSEGPCPSNIREENNKYDGENRNPKVFIKQC